MPIFFAHPPYATKDIGENSWSILWAKKAVAWNAHILRRPEAITYQMLATRDANFLTSLRMSFSGSPDGWRAGRQGTRRMRERVQPRWQECLRLA